MNAISVVKRSPEYRAVRLEVSDPMPSDVWSELGLSFVVFDLKDGEQHSVVMFVVDGAARQVMAVRRISLDLRHETALVTELKLVP